MAEGNWQCGMCAAYNEPTKHACMVCDTFRVLGARGATPDGGDLLASPQGMFDPPGEGPVTVPSPEEMEGLPQVRVMEPPPVRPGGVRSGTEQPVAEQPAVEQSAADQPVTERSVGERSAAERPTVRQPAEERSAGERPTSEQPSAERPTAPVLGPDPGRVRHERREQQAGIDTEPVPVVTEPLAPRPPAAGNHGAPTAWSLPRWPQGTVRALALGIVGAAVLVLVWVLPGDEAGEAEGEGRSEVCPERIAALLPGTGPGPLVESFETERHRIVLCANGAGELYYFGEFLDDSGETMVVPATRTEEGYVADAGQTRYEIGGGVVVITGGDGAEIARLPLESVPAPQ